MNIKSAIEQLRTWEACPEAMGRLQGCKSLEQMLAAANITDLEWVLPKIGAPALAEYYKVRDTAWAEYYKVCDPASAEYDKALATASAEYDKALATALAEYYKVCLVAARAIVGRYVGIK